MLQPHNVATVCLYISLCSPCPPYNRGKVARYYLARTEQSDIDLPIAPELGRPEHSEYRWVDFDEAVKLTSPRLQPVLTWAANVLRLDVSPDG